ncbi:FecR domain-containing protein [Candidatus Pelagibacter sp.]|uniref:FecR family protein n=1 Tax=Candidatus Pelagibacter sp. TaxID=2024849 RepID=UPI003F843AAC
MKIFLKLFAIILLFTNVSNASEIGVIGFITGEAFNQDGKKLSVGDPIYFGDTITTNEGGKSQILFVDQTVMTVGSSTELTIDEFVYDAKKTEGKLLSTIKSGSVKVLTGKISEKNPENLVVETPAGTIGTRGTEFKAAVDPETQKSKILLIGPGPKNSLGLRPGAVEVSNAAGTVLLDKPYLFTEVNQNTAPKQPTIIPQTELKKFQELEIEPDAPVTDSNQQDEEIQLAGNEDEIKELIKDEIFAGDEDVGDLVLDTLVTALAKDDGGITAQLLGKSFLNSGAAIPRALIPDDVKEQLPEGVDINSPEADAFFANELQNELEKVMLVSARIEDVEFVPTEFNQFNAGFSDIKVPIFNDETGDVVFLEMGDIDFKPQFAGLTGNNLDFGEPSFNEQIFLKGQDRVAIDLEKGRFFEQEVDPQIEALNQRFETLLASGATPQELDEVAFEIDQVIFEANEAAQAFEVNAFQNQFGNDFKLDVFSNEDFQRTKESFIFDTNQYSNEWKEASQAGFVPIFELDGRVSRFQKDEADTQWQIRDEQYEQEYSQQFPEIFAAEKKAEELGQLAEQERKIITIQLNEAKDRGATPEELTQIASKASKELEKINVEVTQVKKEIKIAQIKTEVIEIGAEEIIAREAPKEDVKVEEVKEEPKIEPRKIETPKISFDEALRKFIVVKYPTNPLEVPGYREEVNSFTVGTTSYTDLNTRSTGTDTYTGKTTNLIVDRDVSGGAAAGSIAGSFKPTHTINFSTRTINQGVTGSVKIGSVTTARSFTTSKDYNYNTGTTGNVNPAASFSIDSSSNVSNISSSITGDITKTVPASGYEDLSSATIFMTVESKFNNQTNRSFADTVDTTVTVQTTDGSGTNKVSGVASNGRD